MATQYITVRDDQSSRYFVVSVPVDDVTKQIVTGIDTQGSIYVTAAGVGPAKIVRDKLNA